MFKTSRFISYHNLKCNLFFSRKIFQANLGLRYWAEWNPVKTISVRSVGTLSGEEYFNHRCRVLDEEKSKGKVLYPHKFSVSHTADDILALFNDLGKGENTEYRVFVAGRIQVIRESSKKLKFYDIIDNGTKLQIIANFKHFEDQSTFFDQCSCIVRGDIIGVSGVPARTKAGELSVRASEIQVLSPCLRIMPSVLDGVKNQETIYRRRYLDLLFNPSSRKKFLIRSKIISFIRKYLEEKGFTEVETPILSPNVGGASAKPFQTHHEELDIDLFLRIAPELYLKILVVGGMNRVFEIGHQFRNEGLDNIHNPEFTACEFYMAFTDYYDLMEITEDLLSKLVFELFESLVLKSHWEGENQYEINFKPPFQRISFIQSLEEATNIKFPPPHMLHTDDSNKFLYDICSREGIYASQSTPSSKLLDKLFSHFVEPSCIQPTFVIDHPQVMSPLAKSHRSVPGLTERFELLVDKKEICNAYTELNDPLEQRARFQQQSKDKIAGDDEAQLLDENFCSALEYGMPPTGGWGMGIDRLVMLLTRSERIKDVILFPTLKPETKEWEYVTNENFPDNST